jgi:magnesium chelatase family protein
MLGGGRPLRPGEISLAHRGVLFLDELPEFRRSVLEALRQPVEEGEIRVARAHGAARLPARFQLVAAMNPCPCGWWGDPDRACGCDDPALRRYRAKLSGPLLDRIDLCAHMPRGDWDEIAGSAAPESSAVVRARVERARERQAERVRATGVTSNAELPEPVLRGAAGIANDAWRVLERAARGLHLSMRACVRVLRVARSIADLDDAEVVRADHTSQAVALRSTFEAE